MSEENEAILNYLSVHFGLGYALSQARVGLELVPMLRRIENERWGE
jgi:hypothetical protein